MSKELVNRNNDIYFRIKNGESKQKIADEYGITLGRVYQIFYSTHSKKHRRPNDIPEISKACEVLNAPPFMDRRIQNILYRNNYDLGNSWQKLSRKDILKMKNLGNLAVDVIFYAKNLKNSKV